MQYQQRPAIQNQRRARRSAQHQFMPGTLVTAVSIGAVVLLLAVTFAADWMRAPQVNISAAGQMLSPNGDGSYDVLTVNYRLSDDARVTARVYGGASVIRTLAENEQQIAGDHFLTWDGRTDQGITAADGNYRIEISAGGAMRSTAQSVPAQVDTQPPAIQLANMPDGMQVNKEVITLEGVTEPGAIVLLAGSSQPLRVDGTGRFSFQYKLNDGDNRVDLQASDAAGNTTRLQRSVSLVTEPPDIELLRPLDSEWTNEQLLTIEGRTRPDASLTINGQTVRVGADGYFQHQLILNNGENILRIVATDNVGNTATIERVVNLKTGASPIQLNVEDGAIVADPNLQLVGKVEPGSQVTINGQAVAVSMLGDFQYSAPLNSGDNFIQIEARDQAGNVTRMTRRIAYNPGGINPVDRISRNMEQLPMLILPSALIVAGMLAFIYLRQNRVKLSLSVDQPVFAPGGGFGEDNQLVISLDLSKTARVTLEVYDQMGNLRSTILHNRRKMGRRHIFYWNGYDDRGLPLQPGDYTLQAEAGAPPLQVTSAVQVRIERQVVQVQTQSYARAGTVQK